MTTTVFQLPTDDELRADLEAIGVQFGPTWEEGEPALEAQVPNDPARIDAVASMLLRRMAALDADIAQHATAHALEQEALRQRFERRIGPVRVERGRMEAWARDLARVQSAQGGFGKKRSRDTGYGTYGVRTIPAKLAIDEAAFVPWAEAWAPELLRVTLKLPLADARQYLTDAELAATKREVLATPVKQYVAGLPALPPGVTQTPEGTDTFAKPEPIR
jgi:hypothetical protein